VHHNTQIVLNSHFNW